MGITKVMHFERLILQIHEKNEILEVTASIGLFHLIAIHPLWMTSEENLTPGHN